MRQPLDSGAGLGLQAWLQFTLTQLFWLVLFAGVCCKQTPWEFLHGSFSFRFSKSRTRCMCSSSAKSHQLLLQMATTLRLEVVTSGFQLVVMNSRASLLSPSSHPAYLPDCWPRWFTVISGPMQTQRQWPPRSSLEDLTITWGQMPILHHSQWFCVSEWILTDTKTVVTKVVSGKQP